MGVRSQKLIYGEKAVCPQLSTWHASTNLVLIDDGVPSIHYLVLFFSFKVLSEKMFCSIWDSFDLSFYWNFCVSFTSCTPIPHISPFLHMYLLSLQSPYPPKEKKSHRGSCSSSQRVPQYILLSILSYLQWLLQWVIGLVRGCWLLLSYLDPHWNTCSWISSFCPVSWEPCSFGSVGPIPSHAPAFLINILNKLTHLKWKKKYSYHRSFSI